VLGGLALVLTASGLFSVLSCLVEQRTKEIGVRMALGGTARSAAGLAFAQLAKPVAVGLAIGAGLAATLATVLITMPGTEQISTLVRVLDPLAYAGSLLFIVVACFVAILIPVLRARRIDPMATLRQE
jgi:ABC-type antimicrobial peptide transport system permease subunit